MTQGRYRHLSFEEREQIAIWRLEGVTQAEMARRLGRSSSTVNRELGRNRLPSGGYQPSYAAGSYLARRERAALLERDERLERFVVDRLTEGWSPEQIAGWLKAGNEPTLRGLGTETIYRFIYRARQKVEKLWKLLPRGKARRGRRKRRETKSTITDRQNLPARWRSTTDPKSSRIARSSAIGKPTSCSAGAPSRFWCFTNAHHG